MYERSRFHPPFTALVWRFSHRCVLNGPSIEPGLVAVAASHARLPSPFVFPTSFIRMHFLHGGSIPLGSLAYCTFHYTDEASRLLTDTTKKTDTQRFQVAAEWHATMGTSVPGLPIRDCAESCNSSVPRCVKVSTIDVMKKTIFEHLYLVQGLATLYLRVKCPYVLTPPPLTDQRFLDFRAIFFNFTEIQK